MLPCITVTAHLLRPTGRSSVCGLYWVMSREKGHWERWVVITWLSSSEKETFYCGYHGVEMCRVYHTSEIMSPHSCGRRRYEWRMCVVHGWWQSALYNTACTSAALGCWPEISVLYQVVTILIDWCRGHLSAVSWVTWSGVKQATSAADDISSHVSSVLVGRLLAVLEWFSQIMSAV